MSSTMRRGTSLKLSQNTSTIAAIIRLSAVAPGRFSSRLMAGCDQQGAVSDHLGQRMAHPFRRAWVLDAIGQALGDPQPLLKRRQQQDPGVRGQSAAVEAQVYRLARDRW